MTRSTGQLVCWLLLAASASWGQGLVVIDRIWEPEPVVPPPGTMPLPVQAVAVATDIRDGAATTNVEQSFRNPTGRRIEGTFLFPLPEAASVTNFSMFINGEEIVAELLDARRAREIYEGIVRRQQDPALLEYVGRDLFRARIFPIEPNEVKKVRLEYTHAVPAADGLARFVFPLSTRAATMPLPPPGPPVRPMRSDRSEPRRPDPGVVESLSIQVKIRSQVGIKSVYSPSHEIDLRRQGDHEVTVSYEASRVRPTSDFQLFYQLSDAMFGISLLTHREPGEDEGSFMLLLAPKSELREQEVAAKDIIFVIDTSGSMSGEKIEQAKAALSYCLKSLNPSDRFNVIAFSSGVTAWSSGLRDATPEQVKDAVEFVAGWRARGGTNISEALATAIGMMPAESDRPAMLLFMTDGLPTVGEVKVPVILEQVAKQNSGAARVFAFGVGHDVNTTLLDRLSRDHHGTRTYVKPDEDLEVAVSSLYEKIASPVMTNLRLEVQGVRVTDLHPQTLPDLFRGGQLNLVGRYTGWGPATVVLRGEMSGQEEVFEYRGEFPEKARELGFVPRLWATRKVGWLLEELRLHGRQQELVDEVVALATRYGILTPYTSYLVLEPGVTVDTPAGQAIRDRRLTYGGPAGPRQEQSTMGGPAEGAAAPAPTTATSGKDAIARSEAEQSLRAADTVGGSGGGGPVVNIGSRTFYAIDGYLVDSAWPKEPPADRVITVKYGSEAYFDLLGLREGMADILAAGRRIKVKLGEVLLVIDDDSGVEQLTADQRKTLAD